MIGNGCRVKKNKTEIIYLRNYALLLQYKREHEDCLVPIKYKIEDISLGKWVSHQRKYRINGRLTQERIELLDGIGFIWDVLEYQWQRHIDLLKQYKAENGDCNVVNWYIIDDVALGHWVNDVRSEQRNGKLSAERIEQLEDLDFVWDRTKDKFMTGYEYLVDYKKKNGNCLVNTKDCVIDGFNLGTWVLTQRSTYKKNKMSMDRVNLLNDIGFVWNITEFKFSEKLNQLMKYKDEFGDCLVPMDYENEVVKLGSVVAELRRRYKRGKMSPEHIKRLKNIGFIWDVMEKLNLLDELPKIVLSHEQYGNVIEILDEHLKSGEDIQFPIENGWLKYVDDASHEFNQVLKFNYNGKSVTITGYDTMSNMKFAKVNVSSIHSLILNVEDSSMLVSEISIDDIYINPILRKLLRKDYHQQYGVQMSLDDMKKTFFVDSIKKLLAVQYCMGQFRDYFNIYDTDQNGKKKGRPQNKTHGFYDISNRTVNVNVIQHKQIKLSNSKILNLTRYQRHLDAWIRKGHWRVYRNEDGSVRKKVWIRQSKAYAKSSNGSVNKEKTYVIK